jgi:hypothetical protein
MSASRKATVEQQPSRTRKGRTISPGVEIKLELNERDELVARTGSWSATAYLFRADGRAMDSTDFIGESVTGDELRLAPRRKINVDFTFSGLQVKVPGTFYFQIVVQDMNNEAGLVVVETVDTNTFVVYDN